MSLASKEIWEETEQTMARGRRRDEERRQAKGTSTEIKIRKGIFSFGYTNNSMQEITVEKMQIKSQRLRKRT